MWIIAKDGFVSLVEHEADPDLMRARARRREHLAQTFDLPDAAIIDLGPDAPDYRWHADIPRLNVAQVMYDAVLDVDYTSHVKEEVAGDDNAMYTAMLACWTALHRLQDPPRPVPQRDLWEPIIFAKPDDEPTLWTGGKNKDDTCPACGAVSTFVRGAWETVHEDDCAWFHGPDPTDEPTLGDLGDIADKIGELADRMRTANDDTPDFTDADDMPLLEATEEVLAQCEDLSRADALYVLDAVRAAVEGWDR